MVAKHFLTGCETENAISQNRRGRPRSLRFEKSTASQPAPPSPLRQGVLLGTRRSATVRTATEKVRPAVGFGMQACSAVSCVPFFAGAFDRWCVFRFRSSCHSRGLCCVRIRSGASGSWSPGGPPGDCAGELLLPGRARPLLPGHARAAGGDRRTGRGCAGTASHPRLLVLSAQA